MPRLIDADALEAYIKDYACIPCKEYGADKDGIRCDFCGFGFCLEGIKRHTVHDAEPVVRCKDCKECEERHTANYLPFLYCKLHEHSVSHNAFCCWAERREDADK